MSTDNAEPLDTHTTTATIQRWGSGEIEAVQRLLEKHGISLLTPELKALAEEAGVHKVGWPRWMVIGIGMRAFRRALEERFAPPPEPELIQNDNDMPVSPPAPKRKRSK